MDPDAPPDACGPGPYVHVDGGVASYTTRLPIANAVATLDLCPEQTFVANSLGFWETEMTSGASFDPRIEADGFITMRSGQSIVTADISAGAVPMFPTSWQADVFPHVTESSPAILAIALLPLGTQMNPNDPCTIRSGVTFSVVGHPEAVVTYYGGTSTAPLPDPSLTSTSTVASAEISGLSATSEPEIELAAAKPGCDLSFVSYPHTGKYKLENGVLSIAGAFMPPVAAP